MAVVNRSTIRFMTESLDKRHRMFFVYALYSKTDGHFYIGYTNNLERRMLEHRSGKTISTKHRSDLGLIFYEAYIS